MSVLIILIGASLVVAAGFLVSFFWAVRSWQYDDDYSPSVRILFENETTLTSDKSNTNNTDNLNLLH